MAEHDGTLKSNARHRGAALALCSAFLVACNGHGEQTAASAAATRPIQFRDDLGRVVSVAKPPKRIATLLPSHTETVFALGVGERIVGVDDYSDYPPEAARLPKLGGM